MLEIASPTVGLFRTPQLIQARVLNKQYLKKNFQIMKEYTLFAGMQYLNMKGLNIKMTITVGLNL